MTSSDASKRLLILHEGVVPYAYQDSLGYWTIGVGHLIDKRLGGKLPDSIIWALLDHDMEEAEADIERMLPWSKSLDPVRKHVLLDMRFNLGPEPFDGDGFKDWPATLTAIREHRWNDAADAMLQSKWAGQVGRRAQRLSVMMRTGEWPADLPNQTPSGS